MANELNQRDEMGYQTLSKLRWELYESRKETTAGGTSRLYKCSYQETCPRDE